MAASLKVGVGRENILEKAASFSMPASPKDSPNAYGPWRAVRRFVPLFFQPLVLLESRAVTSRQTADPAGCTGRPFQWEGKAGFIRQVPCYNQSPEQCRLFFFVPCAFFNSGYAHFFRLGCPERFIPHTSGRLWSARTAPIRSRFGAPMGKPWEREERTAPAAWRGRGDLSEERSPLPLRIIRSSFL